MSTYSLCVGSCSLILLQVHFLSHPPSQPSVADNPNVRLADENMRPFKISSKRLVLLLSAYLYPHHMTFHSIMSDYQQQEPQQQEQQQEEEETQWTDDRIRWTKDAHDDKHHKEQDDDEEEDVAYLDPFADADPFDSFAYQTVSVRGYKRHADAVWQSTGLTLWRASEYLCAYLTQRHHKDAWQNGRILELGAGLGLCGLWVHHMTAEAAYVCITDGDTDALRQLRENVQRNRRSDRVSARQLLWGRHTTLKFMEQQQQQRYDVLIASDIVYATVIVQPLWETVSLLLQRSAAAVFILAYAKRDVPVTIEDVLDAADAAGFRYQLKAEDPDGIWVYEFQWKPEQFVMAAEEE